MDGVSMDGVSTKTVRILIADNHEITRIGLKSILEACRSYEICGEAENGLEALKKTFQLRPDLLILEASLPLLNGMEVARRIQDEGLETSLLIFTEMESEKAMLDALAIGVKGFVLKSESPSALLCSVEAVARGSVCFTLRISKLLPNLARQHCIVEVLTGREKEIVQLVAEGYGGKDIAQILAVSVKTVDTHRSKIFRKLQVHTVAELIHYAVRNQIVHIDQLPDRSAMWSSVKLAQKAVVGLQTAAGA